MIKFKKMQLKVLTKVCAVDCSKQDCRIHDFVLELASLDALDVSRTVSSCSKNGDEN